MNKEFIAAIDDLVKERGISKDVLIEAIESALVSAYKKNYGTSQNVRVNIDRETGDVDVQMSLMKSRMNSQKYRSRKRSRSIRDIRPETWSNIR